MGNTFKLGNYVNAIFQDASNNVGIGAAPSGSYKLEVTGTGRLTTARTNGTNVNILTLSDTTTGTQTVGFGTKIQYLSNGSSVEAAIGLEQGGTGTNNESQISFYTQNTAGALSRQVIISSTGNFGIGTGSSSPTAKLQVSNGKILLNNGYSVQFINTAAASVDTLQMFTDGNVYLDAKDSTGGALIFRTSNSVTERMRITSAGNVGIGTSSPAVNLDIAAANQILDSGGNFRILTTDTAAIDKGGQITMGGFYNGTSNSTVFGAISARKENNTNNNFNGYIAFATQSGSLVERMRITSGGKVGIGTNNPATQLEINNNGQASNSYFTARMTFADGYRAGIQLINAHTGGAPYYIVSTNNSDGQWGGGKLAISGNDGANGVYLNGVTATSWTGQSDIRLKDIDSEIEDALNKVMQLRGVRFTWKLDGTKKMQVGLIAQEVKEVLPEAVDFEEGNEDYKMGVQYTDIIPLLVNAIKELNERLNKAGL
jgi:hypothetical protein